VTKNDHTNITTRIVLQNRKNILEVVRGKATLTLRDLFGPLLLKIQWNILEHRIKLICYDDCLIMEKFEQKLLEALKRWYQQTNKNK